MLNNVKLLLGITSSDKDNLLNLLISQASAYACAYTGLASTTTITYIIEQMVVFNYNRLGTEGLDSETYSGADYTYSSTYPDYIIGALEVTKSNNKGKLITM